MLTAFVAGLVVLGFITSRAEQWSPVWLVLLLGALTIATEIAGSASHTPGRLQISASTMAVVCAMVLLGPAPAATIAATCVAIEGLLVRKRLFVKLCNIANYGGYALLTGLVAYPLLHGEELTPGIGLLAVAIYFLAEGISWTIAACTGLAFHFGSPTLRLYARQFGASVPSILVGAALTVCGIWTYQTGGGVALGLLGVGALLVQVLFSRLAGVEFELRAERDRATAYLDSAGSLFVILDAQNRVVLANRRAQQVIGLTEHELVGTRWDHLLRERASFLVALERAGTGSAAFEAEVRVSSGEDRVILWSIAELASATGERQLLLSGEDITDRRAAERRLEHLAFHDPLTELPNRAAFARKLSRSLGRSEGCAVLFIDLDGFKRVNDALGHGAGDELLCHAGRRLLGCVRSNDVVARQSGDEFLVLLDALPVAADDAEAVVDEIVERMVASLGQPYGLQTGEARVAASIGVALHPRDGDEPEELIARADHRMYAQKAVSAS